MGKVAPAENLPRGEGSAPGPAHRPCGDGPGPAALDEIVRASHELAPGLEDLLLALVSDLATRCDELDAERPA